MPHELINENTVPVKRGQLKRIIEDANFRPIRANYSRKDKETYLIYSNGTESFVMIETTDRRFAIYRPVDPIKFIDEMKEIKNGNGKG